MEQDRKVLQKNYCGECDCSCTCDAGCKGDRSNCTSEKAKAKGCVHCCACWITPFLESYNDPFKNNRE